MEKLTIIAWNKALRRRNTEEFNRYNIDSSHPFGALYNFYFLKNKTNEKNNMTEYKIEYFPSGLFYNIQKDYEEHDKTCSSIPHMWLGHKGGVSDMWSQKECDGCQVVFYIEGLKWYDGSNDGEIDETNYCDCCDRKRQK